jgi:hypothetical protein
MDKCKRLTTQLKRVLRENVTVRKEYSKLESKSVILETEQEQLQDLIAQKQSEIEAAHEEHER